jgi:hypothetical protein
MTVERRLTDLIRLIWDCFRQGLSASKEPLDLIALQPAIFLPPTTDCPCDVSASTCRSLTTISSGLCRFRAWAQAQHLLALFGDPYPSIDSLGE